MKLGRRPLLRVAVQRELRHRPARAADVGEREVHLALGIRENAKPGDLLRHPFRFVCGLGMDEPHEDHGPRATWRFRRMVPIGPSRRHGRAITRWIRLALGGNESVDTSTSSGLWIDMGGWTRGP